MSLLEQSPCPAPWHARRLVDVVLEDVPAGEDDVVQVRQRYKILDQRRLVVGALAQADGAHLRERADRLGESAANGFNAGDHRGGDGAEADHHDSQFARGGRESVIRGAALWPPCSLLSTLLFLTFLLADRCPIKTDKIQSCSRNFSVRPAKATLHS